MQSVSCDACGARLSAATAICPECGQPMLAMGARAAAAAGVRSARRLRWNRRLSLLTLVAAVLLLLVTRAHTAWEGTASAFYLPEWTYGVLAVLLPVGLLWFAATRFVIWWRKRQRAAL